MIRRPRQIKDMAAQIQAAMRVQGFLSPNSSAIHTTDLLEAWVQEIKDKIPDPRVDQLVDLIQVLDDSSATEGCTEDLIVVSRESLYNLTDYVVNFCGDD